jgi:hypothetical protein
MPIETRWKNIPLPLAAAATAWQGGIACLDTSAQDVTPGAAGSTTLIKVGEFAESFDNSAGTATTTVMVSLDRELVLRWYDSVTGGNAVTASNLFSVCYIADDHTATMSSASNSKLGRVWAVDAVKGIGVESPFPSSY